MQALEEVAARVLPSDMGYAWSNMSYQDAHTTGEATVFLYAIIFIFLILAALYESWSLPLSIILGIPFAVFGAMLFIFLGHLLNPKYINDIFLQVSLIMLIGLAAKNAILDRSNMPKQNSTRVFRSGMRRSKAPVCGCAPSS